MFCFDLSDDKACPKQLSPKPKSVPKQKKCSCGKQVRYCVIHGGSSMCSCLRRKHECKLHSPQKFCVCGKPKGYCIIHWGHKLCPHNRRKAFCKKCKGSQYCECGIQKMCCAKHGGSALCECGKQRRFCKKHKGSSLCPCGLTKRSCKLHGGIDICVCGIHKQYCIEHGGGALCPCKKIKTQCSIHGGSLLCVVCRYMTIQKTGSCCAGCSDINSRKSRFKEGRVAAFLTENVFPKYTRWNREDPGATFCGKYRVDFTWELGSGVESTPCRVVLLEVDEHAHASYPKACELGRIGNIVQGFGGIPVHLVRFNPDTFKLNGVIQRHVDEEYRFKLLTDVLQKAFSNLEFAENLLTVQYLFYNNNEGDEVNTLFFRTLEHYMTWMDKELETSHDMEQEKEMI